MHKVRVTVFVLAVAFLFSCLTPIMASNDFDFSLLEKSVVETTLENGLKIIILPRHDAPVVSFVTWVNVGGSDDPKEYTGLAHMFEHMAFKGTPTIGSRGIDKELKLMAKEDEIFMQLREERLKGRLADQNRIASLAESMEKAIAAAYEMIEPNAFANILQREGGSGLNAYTSRDQTVYHISMPSNKLELWMAMESERFFDPLLREMYRERQVVIEERRMTVDNSPIGKLIEDFMATAFKAHPYRVPILGHISDIENYTREAAQQFFDRYYSPGNMSLAIIGDVNPETVIKMAKKYWGRIEARPLPALVATVEPPQLGERRLSIEDNAQPTLLMGWHTPEATHPDYPALSAMMDILGQGRTSNLYRRMIRDERAAVSASAFTGWPGNKYPALSVVFVYPSQGRTTAECEAIVIEEIEKMKNELLPMEEIEKVRARAMASFVKELRSDVGMAQELGRYQQLWGDWRELFRELDRINAVTPEDVKRVANTYFTKNNRTVATMETLVEQAAANKEAGK